MKLPGFNLMFKHAAQMYKAIRNDLSKVYIDNKPIDNVQLEQRLERLHDWLTSSAKYSVFRVNTSSITRQEALERIVKLMKQDNKPDPVVVLKPDLPEVIIVKAWDQSVELDLQRYPKEAYVSIKCALSVLSGAHIYFPGLLDLSDDAAVNEKVSVYTKINRSRRHKGKNIDQPLSKFIGNGILQVDKEFLLQCKKQLISGVGIRVNDTVSGIPPLTNEMSLKGLATKQTLPSIICTRVLDPQPGERILDMCAAPGRKTSHISNLMKGHGTVIALDNKLPRVQKLRQHCLDMGSDNVQVYHYNALRAVGDQRHEKFDGPPPYSENSFDRILVDAPCTGLGRRPLLMRMLRKSQLPAYVQDQKKLLAPAVRLLKPNGVLVYSTCTTMIGENEDVVAWLLKTFPCLKLKPVVEQFDVREYGMAGYHVDGLTQEQSEGLCRFGPGSDTMGFFIACFVKQ